LTIDPPYLLFDTPGTGHHHTPLTDQTRKTALGNENQTKFVDVKLETSHNISPVIKGYVDVSPG